MPLIKLEGIDVSYDGKRKVLDQLNLEIEKGELVSLLGPSGCGKTTTLRVIAGLVAPDQGKFMLEGKDYTNLPIHKRAFGIVFQSYALFPHLTVEENIAFGLKMRRLPKSEIANKVQRILQTVDLEHLGKRFPRELSGGQRQRVALGRALVVEPELLLLDEPLSNLDAKLRVKMRMEIRELQQKLKITTLFVTHDQEECFSISDRVAVMNGGIVEQYEKPEVLYKRPATEFVARFVGFENFLKLKYTEGAFYAGNHRFLVSNPSERQNPIGAIRPEDVEITAGAQAGENEVAGRVLVRTFLGKGYQYKIDTPLGEIVANDSGARVYEAEDHVLLHFPPEALVIV